MNQNAYWPAFLEQDKRDQTCLYQEPCQCQNHSDSISFVQLQQHPKKPPDDLNKKSNKQNEMSPFMIWHWKTWIYFSNSQNVQTLILGISLNSNLTQSRKRVFFSPRKIIIGSRRDKAQNFVNCTNESNGEGVVISRKRLFLSYLLLLVFGLRSDRHGRERERTRFEDEEDKIWGDRSGAQRFLNKNTKVRDRFQILKGE